MVYLWSTICQKFPLGKNCIMKPLFPSDFQKWLPLFRPEYVKKKKKIVNTHLTTNE